MSVSKQRHAKAFNVGRFIMFVLLSSFLKAREQGAHLLQESFAWCCNPRTVGVEPRSSMGSPLERVERSLAEISILLWILSVWAGPLLCIRPRYGMRHKIRSQDCSIARQTFVDVVSKASRFLWDLESLYGLPNYAGCFVYVFFELRSPHEPENSLL
jgi:hypothetical protein